MVKSGLHLGLQQSTYFKSVHTSIEIISILLFMRLKFLKLFQIVELGYIPLIQDLILQRTLFCWWEFKKGTKLSFSINDIIKTMNVLDGI